jgi:hypothetical protein
LLAAGASPRARDRSGATPAHSAARLGADAWIDALARRDSGRSSLLDEKDNAGVSPLDLLDARYRKSRVRSRFAVDLGEWTTQLQLRVPRPFSRGE